MDRYLIESPHTDLDCFNTLKVAIAEGFLNNFEMGCEDGVHCAYAIIEAESKDQALLVVPPHIRTKAKAIKLTKCDITTVKAIHGE
ncbi:MAG: hypothetical protein ACE5KG_06880 [Nitrososphaerales archaeon]